MKSRTCTPWTPPLRTDLSGGDVQVSIIVDRMDPPLDPRVVDEAFRSGEAKLLGVDVPLPCGPQEGGLPFGALGEVLHQIDGHLFLTRPTTAGVLLYDLGREAPSSVDGFD
jgi:hypothetical protein